jgi:hypothetical protein
MHGFDTVARLALYWRAKAPTLPLRVIPNEKGRPYLSRYTVRALDDGGHLYLHHFHESDFAADLHNHPWSGESLILEGGYIEERLQVGGHITRRRYLPGATVRLEPHTFHRVDLLDPVAGCWTLFTTGQRVQSWGFKDRATNAFTPYRDALLARGITPQEPP